MSSINFLNWVTMIYYIVAPLAVLLVGIDKAGFGGGVGVIAVPLFIIATGDPKASLGIMLPLLCACDVFAMIHYRKTYDRANLVSMVPGALIGIALCGIFLGMLKGQKADSLMQVTIGFIAIAFVVYDVVKIWLFRKLETYKPKSWHGWFFGFGVGVTSTLAHAGGPPAIMFLLPQNLGRTIYVGTTVVLFTFVNAFKLIPYTYHHMINFESMKQSLFLLPLVPIGTYLGVWMNKRINETAFNAVIYVFLFLIGLKLTIGFDPVSTTFNTIFHYFAS